MSDLAANYLHRLEECTGRTSGSGSEVSVLRLHSCAMHYSEVIRRMLTEYKLRSSEKPKGAVRKSLVQRRLWFSASHLFART